MTREGDVTNEIICYSVDEDGPLTAESFSEAVRDAVDQWDRPISGDETVEVTSWRRKELPTKAHIAASVVEYLTQWFYEEYADPDYRFELPDEVINAAKHVADAMHAHYAPRACEPVDTITVRVADHVPEEWLGSDRS